MIFAGPADHILVNILLLLWLIYTAGAGNHTEVSNCPRSPIADLGTGFFSTSRFIIQELPDPQVPPVPPPFVFVQTAPPPAPPTDNYQPIWCHCVKPSLEEFIHDGSLNGTECTFVKQANDTGTVVKVTWDGNLRVRSELQVSYKLSSIVCCGMGERKEVIMNYSPSLHDT